MSLEGRWVAIKQLCEHVSRYPTSGPVPAKSPAGFSRALEGIQELPYGAMDWSVAPAHTLSIWCAVG